MEKEGEKRKICSQKYVFYSIFWRFIFIKLFWKEKKRKKGGKDFGKKSLKMSIFVVLVV